MSVKSVIHEAREINLAIELIKLGARLQFLESETSLSRDRLIKLYKEIRGVSPPKGLLPFSTDWYMTWLSNIHSSMFYNIYRFMVDQGGTTPITGLIKSYQLYMEQVTQQGVEPVLDFTRAWTLVRFFDSNMLHVEHLHALHRPLCGARARPARRLCVRAVPAALARRKNAQEPRYGSGPRAPGAGGQRQEAGAAKFIAMAGRCHERGAGVSAPGQGRAAARALHPRRP